MYLAYIFCRHHIFAFKDIIIISQPGSLCTAVTAPACLSVCWSTESLRSEHMGVYLVFIMCLHMLKRIEEEQINCCNTRKLELYCQTVNSCPFVTVKLPFLITFWMLFGLISDSRPPICTVWLKSLWFQLCWQVLLLISIRPWNTVTLFGLLPQCQNKLWNSISSHTLVSTGHFFQYVVHIIFFILMAFCCTSNSYYLVRVSAPWVVELWGECEPFTTFCSWFS